MLVARLLLGLLLIIPIVSTWYMLKYKHMDPDLILPSIMFTFAGLIISIVFCLAGLFVVGVI